VVNKSGKKSKMIKPTVSHNYQFLITILLFIITLQFIYIVIIKLKSNKSKKRKRSQNNFNDFSSLIMPLSQKINSLKEDKENYKKNLKEIEEEVKLYSEQILNILDIGVLIVDNEENIIYKNNWFKESGVQNLKLIFKTENNDSEININDSSFLIKKQKHENLFIYTVNDITELRKLEDEIALKKKFAYLGEMSAFIAHEFKNSLTAIKGFAAALKRKSDDPKIVKKVSINIEEEVEFFYKMLVDYLNYSKEIKLSKEKIDILEFLSNIKDNFFKNENIKFSTELDFLYIDINKMKQVFINLIKNSVEASEEGSLIEILIEKKKDFICIYIKDKGKGISDDNIDKIFNPFFTTKSSGTGLGTSISYQIITAHNGKLEYLKRKPLGTITFIKIPAE